MGIWDWVKLELTPADEIVASDLVIVPSTRKQSLAVSGRIDSKAAANLWVNARVLSADGKAAVLDLPAAPVAADGTWRISRAFPGAHDWSPEDPFLYQLEITLRGGGAQGIVLDDYTQRFGFKEIWTDGPDIYINGVKRHLLATATWPVADPVALDEIHKRVHDIRASNAVCFRLHTGPWPEAWLDAADEEGLLIVNEGAMYTDGDGLYDYPDPRLWQNYDDHIGGIIKRDRNHPSLALISIENETLFMGNQRYDQQLPRHLGDVARYARALDPTHPTTFEADRDPDGAADVMGLHYPHEPPGHVDYPNTTDWINAGVSKADALGGMLGTTSGDFLWTRNKPLYIGEYLWDPQDDFSDASIFFGDQAFDNRDKYHGLAQKELFYEQTIGYRRDGVSGLCPWTAFGFGAVKSSESAFENQQVYYRPVAAYLHDYGLRCYGGEHRVLNFDVFNDGPAPKSLTLKILRADNSAVLASQEVSLEPGGYKLTGVNLTLPVATTDIALNLVSVLADGGEVLQRTPFTLRLMPERPLHPYPGSHVVAYDPTRKWPDSVDTLSGLGASDPKHTVLLVASHALDTRKHLVERRGCSRHRRCRVF